MSDPVDIAVCNVTQAARPLIGHLEMVRDMTPNVGALVVYEQSYRISDGAFDWVRHDDVLNLVVAARRLGFRPLAYVHPGEWFNASKKNADRMFRALCREHEEMGWAGFYLDGTPPSLAATPDEVAAFYWRLRHELVPSPYLVMHASGFVLPREIDVLPDILRFGEHAKFESAAEWDHVGSPTDKQCLSYITWCHAHGVTPCPKMSKVVAQSRVSDGTYRDQRAAWVEAAALAGCAVWSWVTSRDGSTLSAKPWHKLAQDTRTRWGLSRVWTKGASSDLASAEDVDQTGAIG